MASAGFHIRSVSGRHPVFVTPFLLYRFDAAEKEVLVTAISIESGTIETVLCTGYLSFIKNGSDNRWPPADADYRDI